MAAAMLTAGVAALAVGMVVMITADVGIVCKRACQQGVHRCVRFAADAAVELDTGLRQRHLGAAADTAADQGIYAMCNQESSQCAVTASIGIDYFGTYNLAICNVIDLECFCVSKVLKNFSIFISNCNLHNDISFIL